MMRRVRTALAVILSLLICGIVVLDLTVPDDPPRPDDSNLLAVETGAPNLVSAVYLEARLYDTLFELLVFTVAVIGVRFYLSHRPSTGRSTPIPESHVLQASAQILFPLILILGLYLAFFGHLSPGGGFSGGVVAASGLLLCVMSIGLDAVYSRLSGALAERLEWALPMMIVAVCVLPLAFGRPILSNLFPAGRAGHVFGSPSILLLNVLIGLKVLIGSWMVLHAFIHHRGEI
jgi:multicomponent Na+:H+ antiporter subunit B